MPGNTYGKEAEYNLRLNIGCSRTKIKDGLERLKLAIDKLKK